MATNQLKGTLPNHKPPTFSGDPLDYPAFTTAFTTLVESKVSDPMELLYYLEQYTTGPAKEVIKGCFQRKSESSYVEAKALLKKHFGDSFKIANAHITKLLAWTPIKPNEPGKLREFAIGLEQTRSAMVGMDYMSDLNTAHGMRQLWEKLPRYLRSKWCEQANVIKTTKERMACFEDFVRFITRQADLATDPVYSEESVNKIIPPTLRRDRRNKGSNFNTVSREENDQKLASSTCIACHKIHDLDQCSEFQKQSLAQRKNFLKSKGMCYRCYNQGHIAKFCKQRRSCQICKKQHPTALHDFNWKSLPKPGKETKDSDKPKNKSPENQVNNSRTTVCDITEAGDTPINMGIIPVWLYHKNNPNKKVAVYALLDNASGGTFIKEKTLNELGVEGSDTRLQLTTMHGTKEVVTKAIEGLVAKHYQYDHINVKLPRTYSRQQIPADRDEIPGTEQINKWPHLKQIVKQIPSYEEGMDVGILIGLNCPRALRPRDVVCGNDDEPYAIKSLLGWYINGPASQNSKESISCNRTVVNCFGHAEGRITMQRNVKEIVSPSEVQEMFEIEFAEHEGGQGLSQEDRRFLEKANEGIYHDDDMHYKLSLPFKDTVIHLPNNRPAAEQRLGGLSKKLQNNEQYRKDYVNFINGIIDKGYARKIEGNELQGKEGRVRYIPHHGVYHPHKPRKIRVVFDCSSRYLGESLNDHLLPGPDLTNKLIGVLTRFRQEKIAFMTDIEQMFYQVKVIEDDQDFLRFLWWPEGDITVEPQEYCMTVHLFGAASSPGCSNFALKHTADDNKEEFGTEVAETLRRNFYVDDGLKSVPTVEEGITLIKKLKEVCRKGEFNLTKFISNSVEVNQSIPLEDRAQDIKELELGQDRLPVERALGVHWCVQSDSLMFRIELKDVPCTRRGILSTISSIYDPLGLIAPVVLVGKQILQAICQGTNWDVPLPDYLYTKWEKWRGELVLLQELNVPRSFKPNNFAKVVTKQLHSFSDASRTGYGQASHLRLVDENGKIHCSFVAGKARVTPRKTVTIPRLELSAATVSVRVGNMLINELEYEDVVLGFINNEARRFHVYVANRVQLIRDHTSEQWRHVDTSNNSADEASRGMTARAFLENSRWINGPNFLWQNEDKWPQQRRDHSLLDSDNPEVKKVNARSVSIQENSMTNRLERFSKLAVVNVKRYIQRLKDKTRNNNGTGSADKYSKTDVEELRNAEETIFRWMQHDAYAMELELLQHLQADNNCKDREFTKKKRMKMKKSSGIYRLDPFLDETRMLRVGGRLSRANMSEDVKHPIILPKKGHLTTLVIRHFHAKVQHSGRGITLNELRLKGYWIVNGNSAVRSVITKCVRCRHLRGSVGEQKMADLPVSRLKPAPPFTYCAVNYFGPWTAKQGRKEVKRFTCLASRAVHIELSDSMSTDSFIQTLRRFIARRGPIRELRSDQGTNFVGADNEVKRGFEEMDHGKVKAELLKHNVDWIRNPPAASHFGGVWERQIRSGRNILNSLIKEHGKLLNDEKLRTLLCESEAIINGRPLSTESLSDPFSLVPLTPMTLLTGKSKIVLPPPGKFQRTDLYCRQQWRQVQQLTNEFWKRWKSEYLQSLQPRQKWYEEKRNFQDGDVVLVKNNDLPRNQWLMARVISTQADDVDLSDQ